MNEQVDFSVIGAGLPRTGTHSTMTALEMLLPGNCHHMMKTFTGKRDAVFWPRVESGEVLEDDWKEFITAEGLSGGVDFPMSLYWRELVKMFPDAKVLLTVRDPVKWYNSVKNTIREIHRFRVESSLAAPVRILGKLTGIMKGPALYTCMAPTYLGTKYPGGLFGAFDAGEETAIKFYQDWVDQVIQDIQPEKLLVFDVSEGWEPLCRFLGVPQPDFPFPHTNDTQVQQGRLRSLKSMSYTLWSITAALVGVGLYTFRAWVPKFTSN